MLILATIQWISDKLSHKCKGVMMRIAVMTMGSRGDVQPFVALAVGLQRAGHDVFLAAPPNFSDLAAEYGLEFYPLGVDTKELLERNEFKQLIEGGNVFKFMALRLKETRYISDKANLDTWKLSEHIDAMFFKTGMPPAAYSVARKRGIPGIEVGLWPFEPSRELPSMVLGSRKGRNSLRNSLMSNLTYQLIWRLIGPSANRFRREELDMPPISFWGPLREYVRTGQPTFYAFSPTVLSRPHDWRADAHVIGYLFLDQTPRWKPPMELLRFLENGSKPVYIGFGSMTSARPREKVQIIVEALQRTRQRAVLIGGWSNLGGDLLLPNTIYFADNLPHAWLFPRMAAIMHHGGAGTTAAGLRSGIPSIVVPHNFDQPFWAQRVYELGAGPKPVPFNQFTVENVAGAMQTVLTDRVMQCRAAEVGKLIQDEDSIAQCTRLLHEYVERFNWAKERSSVREPVSV
jgi:UDP:flavonoid glycosyltransferase YjiC (YdhE family)